MHHDRSEPKSSTPFYGEYKCLLHCIEARGRLQPAENPSAYSLYIPLLHRTYAPEVLSTVCDVTSLQRWKELTQLNFNDLVTRSNQAIKVHYKHVALEQDSGPSQPVPAPSDAHAVYTWNTITTSEEGLLGVLMQTIQLHHLVHTFFTDHHASLTLSEVALERLSQHVNTLCPLLCTSPPPERETDLALYAIAARQHCRLAWPSARLEDWVRALLLVPSGSFLIPALVYAFPSQLQTIVDGLLKSYDRLPAKYQAVTRKVLQDICKHTSHRARTIRQRLVKFRVLPEIVLKITLHFDSQYLVFLNQYFDGMQQWNTTQLSRCAPFIHELKSRMYQEFTRAIDNTPGTTLDHPRVSLLLRVLGAFVATLGVHLDERDLEFARKLFPALAPESYDMLLAYIIVSSNPNRPGVQLLPLLEQLKSQERGRTLLFITAIFLRTHEYEQVEAYVHSTLNNPTPCKKDKLYPIREYILQHLANDADLAKFTIKANPSDHDRALHQCAYHLLKHGVFQTHRLDLRPWMVRLIQTTRHPPQNATMSLVKEYVEGTFQTPHITCILESDVKRILQHTDSLHPSHILLVFYLLYYHDSMATHLTKSASGWSHESRHTTYSSELMDSLPLSQILQYMATGRDASAYRDIYPEFVVLGYHQAPATFDVQNSLNEHYAVQEAESPFPSLHRRILRDVAYETLPVGVLPRDPSAPLTVDHVESVLAVLQDPHQCNAALGWLTTLPVSTLLPWVPTLVTTCVPLYLHPRFPRDVGQQFRTLWERLHILAPRQLELTLANNWRSDEVTPGLFPLKVQDLWLDPLILFRCVPQVFQHPDFFTLFLQILGIYMTMSRHKLRTTHLLAASRNGPFKDKHVKAMLYLQDTAILQLLLSICGQTLTDGEQQRAKEIQALVCDFIHQCFIHDPVLCKLLLFQTFPPVVLPLLIEQVPSMHIGLDFVPELMNQTAHDKQVFALQVATGLLEKYPMTKYVPLARDKLLSRAKSLITKFIAGEVGIPLVYPVVDVVTRLSDTFHTLSPECGTALQLALTMANKTYQELNQSNITNHNTHNVTPKTAPPNLFKIGATLESVEQFRKYVTSCCEYVSKQIRQA
ncbi:Integrator complex subunit 2 [Dispira simplex]|nr:Integrator complex subunit 2 [Dispira simplex]